MNYISMNVTTWDAMQSFIVGFAVAFVVSFMLTLAVLRLFKK